MSPLRRATDSSDGDWIEVPEGLWRWVVTDVASVYSEKFRNDMVRFRLSLTDGEKHRLKSEQDDPPDGTQQSTSAWYRVGLSLGFLKNGQYQSTRLVDFLATCFGSTNAKTFRSWIAKGGAPACIDAEDSKEQVEGFAEWLRWWRDMEVYGTIRHESKGDGSGGGVWVNFAGPLPVGSLPGQRDDDYQALGRGKLRALIAETDGSDIEKPTAAAKSDPPEPRSYDELFGDDDAQSAAEAA